jgi:DNA-binding NtrC family response regulator
LNVMTLEMPSLRERVNDLPKIAENHLKFFSSQTGKKINEFSEEAMQSLKNYGWPGNLRELRNAIERAVILATGNRIELPDLPDHLQKTGETHVQIGSLVSLEELEREHIKRIISRTSSLEQAAQVLGIDPATLYRKRKRLAAEQEKIQREQQQRQQAGAAHDFPPHSDEDMPLSSGKSGSHRHEADNAGGDHPELESPGLEKETVEI